MIRFNNSSLTEPDAALMQASHLDIFYTVYIHTGLPARSVEDEDFVKMMLTIDKRLTVPKKAKITNVVDC